MRRAHRLRKLYCVKWEHVHISPCPPLETRLAAGGGRGVSLIHVTYPYAFGRRSMVP